jgi:hypothetical protein
MATNLALAALPGFTLPRHERVGWYFADDVTTLFVMAPTGPRKSAVGRHRRHAAAGSSEAMTLRVELLTP